MLALRLTSRSLRASTVLCLIVQLAICGPAEAQIGTIGEPADLPRRVAVRFMTDSDYPPFHYYDEEGILTGFNVDIARAICIEMSAACDIQVRPWAELLPALRRGEADALAASHAITPNLVREFDVSDRYYYTPARFVGRREGLAITATPEGLEGRRIGVLKGSAHEAYLKTFFHNSAILPFESAELARDALRTAGGVEAVFGDGIGLGFWINGTLSRGCCEFKGGPFFEPKYFGDGVGIVVPKKDAQLKSLINSALVRIRASGRYEELLLRYFPNRVF